VVIADEPTTNLDVSVQAGILQLIRRRIDTDGFGCVFVSHDLGVISAVADRAVVMYAGQVVESGPTDAILSRPAHPYTRGLIAAAPTMSSSLDQPLAPYTSRRPAPSSTRPASRLEAVAGSSDHYVRVQGDLR
jgi:ABC-type glutathione transport system ATPase component